jgi:hypothetical protein
MKQSDIDSILLVNFYLTSNKLSKRPNSRCNVELVRRYLTKRVDVVLGKRERTKYPINLYDILLISMFYYVKF